MLEHGKAMRKFASSTGTKAGEDVMMVPNPGTANHRRM